MPTITLPLPVFGFVIVTRAALAAGVALLVADRLPASRRRAIGTALVAVGAATTVPAVLALRRSMRRSRVPAGVGSDPRLIGATRFARKADDGFI
jgi:hypothetical protein